MAMCIMFRLPRLNLCLAVCVCEKYVGSFPVDDCCLDEQMEQLHTQLKALRVSPVWSNWPRTNTLVVWVLFMLSTAD